MQSPRAPSLALLSAFGLTSWIACSSHPSVGSGGPTDASTADTVVGVDSPVDIDSGECSPCEQTCPCEADLETFTAAGSCTTYTCPSSGNWGPFSCLGPGCPEGAVADQHYDHEVGGCSACFDTCPCTEGEVYTDPGNCITHVCGDAGTWGPFTCGGFGCDGGAETSAD
jgi:hypothetical protein